MKTLKRYLPLLAILLTVCLPASGLMVGAPSVFAVDVFNTCSSQSQDTKIQADCQDCSSGTLGTSDVCEDNANQNKNGTNPIVNDIKIAINIGSFITGAASVIIIIASSLRLIIATDPQSTGKARNGIIYALVGVVITIVAQAIVIFVLDNLK